MFEAGACKETVSLLHAILFGADGACVDVGTGSIVAFVAAFMVCVVALKILGRRVIGLVFRRSGPGASATTHSAMSERQGVDEVDEGPIRSR